MKQCTKCKEIKDLSYFGKDRYKKDNKKSICKKCYKVYDKKRYDSDIVGQRERVKKYRESLTQEQKYLTNRNTKLKRAYGLSHEQVEEMKRLQDYRCYTCGRLEIEAGSKGLVVDHNHTTGKIRKLLCSSCNTALGLLDENPKIFSSFIKYIEEHG